MEMIFYAEKIHFPQFDFFTGSSAQFGFTNYALGLYFTARMSDLVSTPRTRGRPPGAPGPARVLSQFEQHQVLRVARARKRHAARAEAVLALSIGAGLRATEIAELKWQDLYELDGRLRYRVEVKAAYARHPRMRVVPLSAPIVRKALERYGENNWLFPTAAVATPLFLSQKGPGMTAQSIARFLSFAYREAGIKRATLFAKARQDTYFARLSSGAVQSQDLVIARHRFTNVYRAADRVSQYLIRHVLYDGAWSPDDLVFRLMLFKFFNKIETWEALEQSVGPLTWARYQFERFSICLDRLMSSGETVYSAAYIMPSGKTAFGFDRKHQNHLKVIEKMMAGRLPSIRVSRLLESLKESFRNALQLSNPGPVSRISACNRSELQPSNRLLRRRFRPCRPRRPRWHSKVLFRSRRFWP